MAKMFYSSEEVLNKLGITQEQLDQLVAKGNLREFRDGAKKMFKVDEVDDFNPLELSGDSELPMAPEEDLSLEDQSQEDDSGDIISLTDSSTGIELAPMDSGSGLGLMPSDSADHIGLDDSAPVSGEKDDTVITSGIDEGEDEDEGEIPFASSDPLAQTQLTDDDMDRISLDSGSSGSGLLDLSREADDTSLGAELLEEIYPSVEEVSPEAPLTDSSDISSEPDSSAPQRQPEEDAVSQVAEQPVMTSKVVTAYDSSSGLFGAAMIIPFLMLFFLAMAAFAAVSGVEPGLLASIFKGNDTSMIWYITGGAGAVMVLVLVIGLVMMNQGGQPKPKKAREPKSKKAKGKKGRKK